jgi:hypothetical protein
MWNCCNFLNNPPPPPPLHKKPAPYAEEEFHFIMCLSATLENLLEEMQVSHIFSDVDSLELV